VEARVASLAAGWSACSPPRILARMKLAPALLLALASAACSKAPPPPAAAPQETPEQQLAAMYAVVDEVAARAEDPAEEVTFQHLLVGVGAELGRSPGEAEELAAALFARARAGEDFDLLVKVHTNEVHPGIYTLARGPGDPPRVWPRAELVAGLGDTAWRLKVDELGVVPYDGTGIPGQQTRSPLGYHLVKRLK